ncbi:MAG: MBL fold metallo-hydrolase [Rhodococcus sp.]|nr:MBL fold metallo-hydrolase [Rhodococcus sp. (in: high G+C Gram-positive bacteria)]
MPRNGLQSVVEPPVAKPSLLTCCAAIGGLVPGLIRPRPIDRAFLGALDDVGLPNARAEVQVLALHQVSRPVPTAILAEGVRRPVLSGNSMTSYLVRHPAATFVVDPSICTDVVDRAVAELPGILRPLVRPPDGVLDICTSLDRVGMSPADLDFALPTHLHWDHVSGLLDMPDLPVRVHAPERAWLMDGVTAPVGGVRPSLEGREIEEFVLDGPPVLTFGRSHDLFGDGSVTLVDLPGHTPGSIGLLLNTARGPVLLAGDAAWHHLQIEHVRSKASFPGLLVDADRGEALRTLHRLHAVRSRVRIVPTHDHDASQALN